jgi:hypothetical protein
MATNPSINPEKICIGKIVDARNLNKMQQRKAFALWWLLMQIFKDTNKMCGILTYFARNTQQLLHVQLKIV